MRLTKVKFEVSAAPVAVAKYSKIGRKLSKFFDCASGERAPRRVLDSSSARSYSYFRSNCLNIPNRVADY